MINRNDKNDSGLPLSKTLSVMLTYRCTAQCAACGTFSSPRDKNTIPLSDAISAIDQAFELGFSNVVFTGGEVTLEWDNLLLAIAHATHLGFPTRIVTNAHWASSFIEAKDRISALMSAGLKEINFSTGDEHLRFIREERIVLACRAAIESRLTTVLMFELRENSKASLDSIKSKILEGFDCSEFDKYFKTIESPWMPMDGFKRSETESSSLANKRNLASRTGCDSVLQTYVLQGDGRIASCCGLGMRSIKELQVSNSSSQSFLSEGIEAAESDWVKVALRYMGPEKILAWAAEFDSRIEWENFYAHRCHACIRIYRDPIVREVIRERLAELIPNLALAIYLDEYVTPAVTLLR